MIEHLLAGNPGRHLPDVPFAEALGLRWGDGDCSGACIDLPLTPSVVRRVAGGIDPHALFGLIDQTAGSALYLAMPTPSLAATVQMHVELRLPAISGAVSCTAHCEDVGPDTGSMIVEVQDRSGVVAARGNVLYLIGAHAGVQPHSPAAESAVAASAPTPTAKFQDFDELVEVCSEDPAILKFRPELIGSLSLPAIHGGAIAAAMARAALRLVVSQTGEDNWIVRSASFHFLRAAHAEDTLVQATLHKRGKRFCVAGVTASQRARPGDVTGGEFLLIRT